MPSRKYQFAWDLLGDLSLGRPNLGPSMRVEVYRLMQFTLRAVLEEALGTEATDDLFRKAGRLAGEQFFRHVIRDAPDLPGFIRVLQETLPAQGIGVLRVEEENLAAGRMVLTVSEDLDCSGLPEQGDQVCIYDEGFLEGLLGAFTGKRFRVREIDCWCTGDRTCRFLATALPFGEAAT
ncbi:4-vinyl reductase [Myxococcota bacterium]|nr:4-vinyl reductase [Myxococcota bacterium]